MKNLVRKYFSSNVKNSIRDFLTKIDLMVFPFFTGSPFLSSLYYLLFSAEFRREHNAVLNGRLAYHRGQQVGQGDTSNVLLRRNTHRLEKGLIMKPRRPLFAEKYIQETVECYARCVNDKKIEKAELIWANDVLVEYFEVVSDSEITLKARNVFKKSYSLFLNKNTKENKEKSIPYLVSSLPEVGVDYEQFKMLCIKRRSVRWYDKKAIPDELVNQAIEVASLAPSACNRQPFEFYVVNDMEKAPQVAALAGGTAGFAQNIPCVIVIVGDLSSYPMERDRHIIYIDASLASMQLMLSLETLGLSSCSLNWPDLEVPEQKMAKLLKLPAHKRPIMLMSAGYADKAGLIPCSPKKPVNALRKNITL
jgi:nitroreductase